MDGPKYPDINYLTINVRESKSIKETESQQSLRP